MSSFPIRKNLLKTPLFPLGILRTMHFHIIRLKNVPIFEQLLLEEQLLRSDERNFLICNEGSSKAIVMGISGKVENLVDVEKAKALSSPLIKRYSGGGTVFIDENTLFLSFICNKKEVSFEAYPEKIMKWSEEIYQKALDLPGFALKENDFVIGDYKCGGNAQYITKNRFVQHTSFLWSYLPQNMAALLNPSKAPKYREGRDHMSFLCMLKDHLLEKNSLFEKVQSFLEKAHSVEICQVPPPKKEVRISTKYIDLP